MLEFNTKEELQSCEELRNMGRYQWQKVKLEGREVIACTTNQQYEDIIWGKLHSIFEELNEYYGTDIWSDDLASVIRDEILERLENEGIEFVDVFDEY